MRTVSVGDESLELCGGTHVRSSADLRPFKILSQEGLAAGVRRVHAVAGWAAAEHLAEHSELVRTLAAKLKCQPSALTDAVDKLAEKQRAAAASTSEAWQQLAAVAVALTKPYTREQCVVSAQRRASVQLRFFGESLEVQKQMPRLLSEAVLAANPDVVSVVVVGRSLVVATKLKDADLLALAMGLASVVPCKVTTSAKSLCMAQLSFERPDERAKIQQNLIAWLHLLDATG